MHNEIYMVRDDIHYSNCYLVFSLLLFSMYTLWPPYGRAGYYIFALRFLHCVPKKWTTKLMAVTLSNLNRFSKFFHC